MSEQVSSVSWFSRIKDAFVGMIFGFALFVAAFFLLFWNEGRAVKTAKALEEGAGAVVSVAADKVDPANQGRLVHVSGDAATSDTLRDETFGLSASAVRLRRKVEMYQWSEKSETKTEKQIGGSEVKKTVYTYDKAWSDHLINSSSFHDPGHGNPTALPYGSQDWTASKVALGAFALTGSLVAQMDAFQPFAAKAVPPALSGKVKLADGSFYQGADPANPQVGDARVSFQTVAPQTVSVVSKQSGSTFEPYMTKVGRTLDMLSVGSHGADEMFATAMANNRTLTWVLRAVGYFMMFLGLFLLFRPLDVLADVLPLLGSVVTAGTAFAAFLIATAASLVTIALAWIAYRPLIGGALLVAGIAVFVKAATHKSAAGAARAKTA